MLRIKDLKDLSVFSSAGYYRHAGPKGPEEAFFHRRARACPSPCLGRENGLGLRSFFARVERSRGTGPRATGQEGFSSRSFRTLMFSAALRMLLIKDLKDLSVFLPEVTIDMQDLKNLKRCFRESNDRGGQAPALRLKKRAVSRRTRALACHTRMREGSPRHANRLKQDLQEYHDLPRLEMLMHRIPRGLPQPRRCTKDLIL